MSVWENTAANPWEKSPPGGLPPLPKKGKDGYGGPCGKLPLLSLEKKKRRKGFGGGVVLFSILSEKKKVKPNAFPFEKALQPAPKIT